MKEYVFNKKVSVVIISIWLCYYTGIILSNIDWSTSELEINHDFQVGCTWSDVCETSSYSENPIEATIMITFDIYTMIMIIFFLSYLLVGGDEEEYQNWKRERETNKKKKATCNKCGAKMYNFGLIVKKYHCHTCCQTCGGADRYRLVAFDFEAARKLKPCTCPMYVSKCSNCGELNCAGCDF